MGREISLSFQIFQNNTLRYKLYNFIDLNESCVNYDGNGVECGTAQKYCFMLFWEADDDTCMYWKENA